MKIIEFPISKLVPHADNPRHNEDAVPGVAESIKQFGFKVPIVIDGHRGISDGAWKYTEGSRRFSAGFCYRRFRERQSIRKDEKEIPDKSQRFRLASDSIQRGG